MSMGEREIKGTEICEIEQKTENSPWEREREGDEGRDIDGRERDKGHRDR